jgi:hypothetical protein
VVEQQEVRINIEIKELKIQIDTRIHLVEQLVMITDAKPVGPLPEMMFFDTKRLLHPIPKPCRLKNFNFKGQQRI